MELNSIIDYFEKKDKLIASLFEKANMRRDEDECSTFVFPKRLEFFSDLLESSIDEYQKEYDEDESYALKFCDEHHYVCYNCDQEKE